MTLDLEETMEVMVHLDPEELMAHLALEAHQVKVETLEHPAHLGMMATTDLLVKMEKTDLPVLPEALDPLALLDTQASLDPPAPLANPVLLEHLVDLVTPEIKVVMDLPDPVVQGADPASVDHQAHLVRRDRRDSEAHREPEVPLDHQDLPEIGDHLDQLAHQDRLAEMDPLVPPETPEALELLVPPAQQDNLAKTAGMETRVTQDPEDHQDHPVHQAPVSLVEATAPPRSTEANSWT